MAWSAPATWSVSEIVTAAKMNTHVRDNLQYLKGQAGAVVLEDQLFIPLTSGTNGKGLRFGDGSNQYGSFQALDLGSLSYLFFSTNRYYDGTGWQQLNARAGSDFQISGDDEFIWYRFAAASSAAIEEMRLDAAGNLGIGTNAPQGKLHVAGAGGSMLFLSANAVDNTLQTLAASGTVAQFALFYLIDYNNTSAAIVPISGNGLKNNQTFTITNTDTITVAVTTGGAITVQRTAGSNGTHNISMLVLFK